MHDGKYEPQAAFLRMKQDIENSNPQMWDLAAYRVPKGKQKHLRTPEWKIFPTYDFAHCLCDSIEGVTHSLCTTEFVQARESYEWLNSTLGVYEPIQREFGKWVYFPLNQNFFSFAAYLVVHHSLLCISNSRLIRVPYQPPHFFPHSFIHRAL